MLPLTGRARVLALGLGGFVMLACAPAQLPNPEAVEPVLTPASGETARLAAPEAAASSVGLGADGKPARQGLDLAAPLGTDRPEPSPGETAREPELPRGTLVLHVGDSFAGSLGVPLSKRLKAAGLRSVLEYQTASYIPTWASSAELGSYVARYSPDLVLITLGANEFELSAPDTRANAVRRLVRRLEGRPCVWVSPPRWKPDTGILRVIRENLKPCRFLDSDTIVRDLARKKDRIHPSDEAREIWADAVMNWLARERKSGAERPWELREE
ncbi:MAG TPA: SGNH/GDSL hydrolase family protein [Polyangiaceae bacterium]